MEYEFILKSPYILFDKPIVHFPREVPLAYYLDKLCQPKDLNTNPYWQTNLGVSLLSYRSLVAGEFVRRFINKHCEYGKLPRNCPKYVKNLIRLEADLWGQLWRAIRLMPTPLVLQEVQTFYRIIRECALVVFFASSSQMFERLNIPNLTGLYKQIQKQNRQLQSCENPFLKKITPFTYGFIEQAIYHANINNDFYRDYMKLVRSRMKFTTYKKSIKGEQRLTLDGFQLEHRGRKAK